MSTLPPISDTALPADIRKGSATDKANYKTALSFERELVEQLTQQLSDTMTPTSGSGGGGDTDGGGSSDATSQQMQQMLQGVLADSIMSNGGLGLARQIAQNLKDTQS